MKNKVQQNVNEDVTSLTLVRVCVCAARSVFSTHRLED